MDSEMFFQSGSGLLRVAVVGALAYIALIVLLRGAGPRALSKLSSYDFVVTVALGSILATILVSRDVALIEGVTAFVVLLALQFSVTSLSVRFSKFSTFMKSEPVLLLYRGELLPGNMKRARVVPAEIEASIRQQGHSSSGDLFAVVLESDGTFSVTTSPADGDSSAFTSVSLPDE